MTKALSQVGCALGAAALCGGVLPAPAEDEHKQGSITTSKSAIHASTSPGDRKGAYPHELISISVNRAKRTMTVYGSNGEVILSSTVGVGRGGLKRKLSMEDMVTPTGDFTVDIVLSNNEALCKIDPALAKKYNKSLFSTYVSSQSGLLKLFRNMCQLDFDGDAKPDTAYGAGYIGLSARGGGLVTGPKAHLFKGKPYWYSIALHGTPTPEKALGRATSGGCVHVDERSLEKLLELTSIGTRVQIYD